LKIYSANEAFEVQFVYGGSGAPSRIRQVEAFSVLIHLGLLIAGCWLSTLGFRDLKPHRSFVLCLGFRLQWNASGRLCNFLLPFHCFVFLCSKFIALNVSPNSVQSTIITALLQCYFFFLRFFPLPVLSSCFYLIMFGKKIEKYHQ